MADILHRLDGPALEWADGTSFWYFNDELHRIGGPAIYHLDPENPVQEWWVHGELHREDGPATTSPDGTRPWYLHNQRHRTDGPAIVGARDRDHSFWLRDEEVELADGRLLAAVTDPATRDLVADLWSPGVDVATLISAVRRAGAPAVPAAPAAPAA